jgi:hypothetical protein
MSLSTRELTERLKSIQEVDLEIRKLRKEESRWPAILSSRGKEVDAKRRKAQEAEEAHKTFRRETDRLDLDLKSIEEAARNLQIQMNTAKTNKEYSAFVNEIAHKKAEAAVVEENLLKHMDRLEEMAREIAAAKAALDAGNKEQEKIARQAEAERKEIDSEIRELLEKRTERIREVPADILQQYERIAGGRNGTGIAAVSDGVCQGCFINLTAQEINLLMQEAKIVNCRNCSRILFMEGA